MVRRRYLGLLYRLQHLATSMGPSSMRSLFPWVSSLFDDLTNKLQMWDKVASRWRDNALYRGAAPFAVSKHVLLLIDQHRLHPCHNGMHLCGCHPQVHIPFWPVGDVVQEVTFANQENNDSGRDYLCPRTRAPVSPTVARPLTIDPLDKP